MARQSCARHQRQRNPLRTRTRWREPLSVRSCIRGVRGALRVCRAPPTRSVNRRAGFAITPRSAAGDRSPAARSPSRSFAATARVSRGRAAPSAAAVTMRGFKRQVDGSVRGGGAGGGLCVHAVRAPDRRFLLAGADGRSIPARSARKDGNSSISTATRFPTSCRWDGGPPARLAQRRRRPFHAAADARRLPATDGRSTSTTLLFDADGGGTADLVMLGRRVGAHYPDNGQGGVRPAALPRRATAAVVRAWRSGHRACRHQRRRTRRSRQDHGARA